MTNLNKLYCSLDAFSGLSADILRLGKSIRFQARGNSMRPLLRDGDTLLIKPLGSHLPIIGEVVLCNVHPERVIVHRVIGKRVIASRLEYLVHGDQALNPDGWISVEEILGRVVKIEREGKSLKMDHPAMKLLGLIAVMRSKWNIGRKGIFQKTGELLKRLPALSIFLS